MRKHWLVLAILLAPLQSAFGVEHFDRGVIALPMDGIKVYVGWRLLEDDPIDVGFNVYRSETADSSYAKLNESPIVASTNYLDVGVSVGTTYYYKVLPVNGGKEGAASKPFQVTPSGTRQEYVSIKLAGEHDFRTCGIADLDGDGAFDYIIKQPSRGVDPGGSYWRPSTHTYKIEAYRSDGTFLWRHDLGWAVEAGIWYSPFVVVDADGDGKAEIFTKYGEGDHRDKDGRVRSGPEYLARLNGLTGVVEKKIPWHDRKGYEAARGETGDMVGYNKSSRNLMAVAYLDGKTPSVIMQRGTYGLIRMTALDADLNRIWYWDTTMEKEDYAGQGAHGFYSVDVDGDGNDELLYGAACLDENGKGLWTLEMKDSDACYVGDIDPTRPGLEVFYGFEESHERNGVCLVDARTGKILWGYDKPTTHIHDQGMVADIFADRPGLECFAAEQNGSKSLFYDAKGTLLAEDEWFGGLSPKAVRWDADPQSEVILRQGGNPRSGVRQPRTGPRPTLTPEQRAERTRRWRRSRRQQWSDILAEGYRKDDTRVLSTVRGRLVGIADVLGDWREEIITSLNGEMRIYSTNIPAKTRQVCLMQDRTYRNAITMRTMGYWYPALLGERTGPTETSSQ